MDNRVVIVDDFYANPDAVRRRALASDYANIEPTDYPGFASRLVLEVDALKRAFSDVLGTDLYVDDVRFTWGGFRSITVDTGSRPKVHADTAIDWAGMVYLTPGLPPSAGTGVYRHRASGFTSPPTDREARALGYADASEFEDQVIQPDKANLSKWEEIGRIAPVYNRLVLFRGGEQYHAPLAGHGRSPDTGRLTHNFFFNEMPAPGRFAYAITA
ncbi:MAG: DUF6445 family protein [Chloroflexi bacterium]|nr:DUF6445 family protein [Chloroflexota bacterium]